MDLPNRAERKQILAIPLRKRKRNAQEFDVEGLATAARGFSGAELESAVQTALYVAYAQKQRVNTNILLDAFSSTVPLSTTRAEEIEGLRDWARTRAVPASIPESQAGKEPSLSDLLPAGLYRHVKQ